MFRVVRWSVEADYCSEDESKPFLKQSTWFELARLIDWLTVMFPPFLFIVFCVATVLVAWCVRWFKILQRAKDQRRLVRRPLLWVFDFDGVLAIPFTHPEKLFEGVPDAMLEIKRNSPNHRCVVASFNPRAELSVSCSLVGPCFAAFRSRTHDQISMSDDERLCKSKQISSMIKTELAHHKFQDQDIVFFDDDMENLQEVQRMFPSARCKFICSATGLTRADILPFLPT